MAAGTSISASNSTSIQPKSGGDTKVTQGDITMGAKVINAKAPKDKTQTIIIGVVALAVVIVIGLFLWKRNR